ncbi:flagellar hook-length control protein FliK [Pseudoalteromonas sp. T1lg23B]|uniref:flagellar hook-length control protein FliK n=1 Tax=Pseudoalteromonas sp. T1lg23B TaxID=2077097 RepID=UPI00131A1018|nr:flagellar hook-length control protein FliK [Pseudoalteromonas sp. T1lg23B]
MLNVTINNSVKTSIDAGAAEYANTQGEGTNEEQSFFATFAQISSYDTRKESNSTQGESQSEDVQDTSVESLAESELDAVLYSSEEDAEQSTVDPSEADADTTVLLDAQQTSKQSQRSADDLLAQINAANQQKTDVTRYQTDGSAAKTTTALQTGQIPLGLDQNISGSDIKVELIEEPADDIVLPPKFVAMTAEEELAEQQNGAQSSDSKGKAISSMAESQSKQSSAELVSQNPADGQEKAGDKAVKLEPSLLMQEQINSTDDTVQATAMPKEQHGVSNSATVRNAVDLAEQQSNVSTLKKNELAQQVSDIAKQNSAKTTLGSAQDNQVPAELKATLEQQLALLTPKERSALQQGLQQLSNEGKASPVVEQALQQLKELEQSQATLTKQVTRGDDTVAANVATVGNKSVSYNSTKIDKDATKQDVKVSQKAMDSADGDSFHSDMKREALNVGQLAQTMPTPQVEQLFKAIATPIQTNSLSSQFSELVQYLEQLDAAPQSTQTQQLNATSQKVQVDAQMLQAVNIARNDAAKILQEKVSMMLNLNNQEAEIRLDPRELGSMQIRIRTDAEQAQVNFVVQNQQAKDLLEQSMPKLREMLAEQGIELGQSNIEQGGEGQQEQMFGSNEDSHAHSRLAEQSEQDENSPSQTGGSLNDGSSIDYYA